MGVFTQSSLSSSIGGSIECNTDNFMEASYIIAYEAESNYNSIMKAMGLNEISIYESTGVEMVYEASSAAGFLGKVKEFFVNLLKKIEGLFKRFFALLDGFVKSDKDFVKKYERTIGTVNTSGFKYKGYKFNLNAVNIGGGDSAIQSLINSKKSDGLDEDAKSDLYEEFRGKVFSSSKGKLESNEFSKELFEALRSGENSKDDIEGIKGFEQLSIISSSAKSKKDAEAAYKPLKKAIEDAIKLTDTNIKNAGKNISSSDEADTNTAKIKVYSDEAAMLKEKAVILNIANGALLTAIRDKNRQAKAICVALVGYKPKHEGYGFEGDGDSFLSRVNIK